MAIKSVEKPGHYGRLFQRFEDYKDAQEGVSEKTMDIYENTWKFFGPGFEEDHDHRQCTAIRRS